MLVELVMIHATHTVHIETIIHLGVWAIYTCFIHHILIKIIHLLVNQQLLLVALNDSLFALIQFLQVLLHLQVHIEVL